MSSPVSPADTLALARKVLQTEADAILGLIPRLDDTFEKALTLIHEWNSGCEPPWTERELVDKIQRARRYGREPLGGLLEARDA